MCRLVFQVVFLSHVCVASWCVHIVTQPPLNGVSISLGPGSSTWSVRQCSIPFHAGIYYMTSRHTIGTLRLFVLNTHTPRYSSPLMSHIQRSPRHHSFTALYLLATHAYPVLPNVGMAHNGEFSRYCLSECTEHACSSRPHSARLSIGRSSLRTPPSGDWSQWTCPTEDKNLLL